MSGESKFSFEKEMAQSTVSMKLLIDTKEKRVLFAEAGKECVDFLFHLLSLPVATIVRLLRNQGMEGSLPNLYKSLENLNTTYIEPGKSKDTFLQPVAPVSTSSVKLLGIYDDNAQYKCTNNYCSYRDESFATPGSCSSCGHAKSKREKEKEDVGLVKGVVTYMVMDDLEVKPMSTISSLTLLNQFHVKDVGDLEEKVVELGMDEGIKLLKTSLQSKNVLTEVFC